MAVVVEGVVPVPVPVRAAPVPVRVEAVNPEVVEIAAGCLI